MLDDIKQAKKSIYLESFILTDDSITHEFFEELENKARAGVRVKIVVDRLADLWYGSINKTELQEAGAEILFFDHWFYHNHRKILVVDEEIAFIGGVNVGGKYAKWLDLHMRLTGKLVRRIAKSFSRVYGLAGGNDPVVLNLRKSKFTKAEHAFFKAKTWFIEHRPLKGKSQLRAYYKKKCREAKHKITIATPYFFPHRWFIKSLREASSRGVKIEVIVPEETDFWTMNVAHRVFARSLSGLISFFFIPEMNHAKVLLVDDCEGLIGSNNIDAQSFDINLEASVIFQRKDMVGNLRNILERWKKMAIPLDQVDHYSRWYHKILGFFIKFLQPIL